MDYDEPRSLAEHDAFERMCLGKERYTSESAARAALKMYIKEHRLRSNGMVPYKCSFGPEEHWHFGH